MKICFFVFSYYEKYCYFIYKGPILRPSRDVIDGVIEKQYFGIIWDDIFIYEVKLRLCWIFQNFQHGRHFEFVTNFFTGSDAGIWIYKEDSH